MIEKLDEKYKIENWTDVLVDKINELIDCLNDPLCKHCNNRHSPEISCAKNEELNAPKPAPENIVGYKKCECPVEHKIRMDEMWNDDEERNLCPSVGTWGTSDSLEQVIYNFSANSENSPIYKDLAKVIREHIKAKLEEAVKECNAESHSFRDGFWCGIKMVKQALDLERKEV